MVDEAPDYFNLEEFVPSLRQAVEAAGSFNLNKLLGVAIAVKEPQKHTAPVFFLEDKRVICVTEGHNSCIWKTDSLRALFRGHQQPPKLGDYPEAYEQSFMLLDWHALEFSRFFGDRRDAEMLEIYSWLRRRPDGKSLSPVHDYMWQAAALMLGTRPLSQAEFEAIMGRLERSCRTFQMGPGSKNYIATLRSTIGQGR